MDIWFIARWFVLKLVLNGFYPSFVIIDLLWTLLISEF
jgi:hypothetical protein